MSFRKTADVVATIAEQYAPGAMVVEQFAHQALNDYRQRRVRRSIGQCTGTLVAEIGGNCCQRISIDTGVAVAEPTHEFADCCILTFFVEIALKRRISMRIEQSQAGEVTFDTKLLRCRGQQQQSADLGGQALDGSVRRAAFGGSPGQMMRFVDDQQIPARGLRLRLTLRVSGQQRQWAQDELRGFERIALVGRFEFFAGFLVEDGEFQIKSPQHLDQPLVDEIFRHDYQHSFGAAKQQLSMHDKAGFNCFAETDFVGQQYARCVAASDFVGDIELMGQQLDPWPDQTTRRRGAMAMLVDQRQRAQTVARGLVDLAGK